jgi:uncharacterized protein YjbJ (UPF0337 family)
MDKDRVAGSAKKAKGSVKEAIGKVTGDSKTQAEGAAEKTVARRKMLSEESKTRCAAPPSPADHRSALSQR